MIKEVTYYQAVCDACGTVDDGGEYSAFSEPDAARMAATDCAEWAELEVAVLPGTGPAVYKIQPLDRPPRYVRSVLICGDHGGDGIHWCARCDDDLDEARWALTLDGSAITNVCPNRHLNTIALNPEPGDPR